MIANYLNEEKFTFLNFTTKEGTNLVVELSKYSKWITSQNIDGTFINFPSYEVFKSPRFNSAYGKILLIKPSYLYGSGFIKNAELDFLKGKIINCKTKNLDWQDAITYEDNNLNRIGEIALVTLDSPIAKLNQTFNNLLIDENSACHIALGDSIDECINIDSNLLNELGKTHYNFNSSLYHEDLIIGNETISVEAYKKGKTKILIKNGKWRI